MENKYMLYYIGLASTPNEVGLINLTTKEIICSISCDRPSGRGTRRAYDKYSRILKDKYNKLINH